MADPAAPVAPTWPRRPEPAACVTPDDPDLWELANAQTHPPAMRPCADCPAPWARSMRAEQRCNGMPGASAAA